MSVHPLSNSQRYAQFVHERFPLSTHIPMILSFSCANIAVATMTLGHGGNILSRSAACLIAFFFFLRLRLFDELKDFDYDRIANPDRPLARGLVKVPELRRIIGLAAVLEFLLVLFLSASATYVYLTALSFSLLMFKEFFIGKLIRPHLTTYAITHTFVSVLMGYTVAAASHNVSFSEFPLRLFLFGVVNWALFNVFEFARKTYSRDEERAGIETYSSKFSLWGAIALTTSQVVIVAIMVTYSMPPILKSGIILYQFVLMALLMLGMIQYLFVGTKQSASTYRALAGLYIVFSYVGFAMVNT